MTSRVLSVARAFHVKETVSACPASRSFSREQSLKRELMLVIVLESAGYMVSDLSVNILKGRFLYFIQSMAFRKRVDFICKGHSFQPITSREHESQQCIKSQSDEHVHLRERT